MKKQPFGCISKVHVKNCITYKPVPAGASAVCFGKKASLRPPGVFRNPPSGSLIENSLPFRYTRTIYTPQMKRPDT